MLAFAPLTAAVAIVAPPALDSPVYSLVTRGPDGRANMNIVTYFTAVAHAPERWYAASLYHGTESRENFLAGNGGVVQILSDAQADVGLLELLGKQSARDVDKLAEIERRGLGVRRVRDDWPVLSDCVGCFELAATSVHTCGDHDVALCRMLWYEDVVRDAPPLRTAKLREIGILPPAPT